MITTAKIKNYDGEVLTVMPRSPIDRELMQKQVGIIEIRLNDGRSISAEQRRKIFAIIKEISLWSGHYPEEIRQILTWDFICIADREWFSLSDVDMTTAKGFIDYLIEFCFRLDIPTKDTLLNNTDNISKYLYYCLEYRRCAVCNKQADIHHVEGSRVGMGRDREHIAHIGLEAIALCREHHNQAHRNEKKLFEDYHIYGIKLDEYLCKKLSLRQEVS